MKLENGYYWAKLYESSEWRIIECIDNMCDAYFIDDFYEIDDEPITREAYRECNHDYEGQGCRHDDFKQCTKCGKIGK